MIYKHIPVMLKEAIEYLAPKEGSNFIDCTLGGAGYTIEIAKRVGARGKVLAIDADKLAIKNAEEIISKTKIKNIILTYGNFKDLQKIVEEKSRESKWNGIVFDLGLSSAQLEDEDRGFSFQLDAPLNMAFGQEDSELTEDLVNLSSKSELERIIREYGEEKFAGRIARGIVETRKEKPIKTTEDLLKIIEKAVPGSYKGVRYRDGAKKIHFATRTFQALRIATNKELESLEKALPQALELLEEGGRIVVISYHSLEDRIVKQFFKKESKECLCSPESPICQCNHKARIKIITRKILTPSEEEIKINPRARSAKMRVAEKNKNQ